MDVADTARRALEIMAAEGWNKGFTTKPEQFDLFCQVYRYSDDYRNWWVRYSTGSHCIGGLWNIASHGTDGWGDLRDMAYMQPLADAISAQYPVWDSESGNDAIGALVVKWNNAPSITEDDVRSVLEKLAAG
jgi:hypothetical protein